MIDERGIKVNVLDESPEEKILQAVESSIFKVSSVSPHDDQDCSVSPHEILSTIEEEESVDYGQLETVKSVIQERSFQGLLKEVDDSERVNCRVEGKKVEVFDKQKTELLMINGSEATAGYKISNAIVKLGNDIENKRQSSSKINTHSQRSNVKTEGDCSESGGEYTSKDGSSRSLEYNLQSYGSMRKEKEWNRTLACKILEEKRRNVDDSEGMDLLWESYEVLSTKANAKTGLKRNGKPKGKIECYEDEDEEEDIDVKICCLQAFKLSAGKMNLGVGRQNLARFSKAVKGIGWFHRVSRHGKKVHNGDTL